MPPGALVLLTLANPPTHPSRLLGCCSSSVAPVRALKMGVSLILYVVAFFALVRGSNAADPSQSKVVQRVGKKWLRH
jgi:hypothetical protein